MVGTSGSGKSTLARAAAAGLGIRHVELDAIRHQPGWQEMPDDQFLAEVGEVVATGDWVIDGNYSIVQDVVGPRVTSIVWLDLPRWLVMAQVIWRSFGRAALRKELWNGNRESFRNWVDPVHPIRWAWSTHARRRQQLGERMDDRWVRLRTRKEASRWLASLESRRPAV